MRTFDIAVNGLVTSRLVRILEAMTQINCTRNVSRFGCQFGRERLFAAGRSVCMMLLIIRVRVNNK